MTLVDQPQVVARTGTDGVGVSLDHVDYGHLDAPAVIRRGQRGGTAAPGNGPCGDLYNAGWITHFSSGPFFPTTNPTTSTTAGVVTYTPGALLGQLILRDPNGAARSDVLPTAADLVAAIPGATIGTSFVFYIRNDADAAETITLTAGTGGTVTGGGTMTVAQNNLKAFMIRFTAVQPGSEAYIVYSLGTVTF